MCRPIVTTKVLINGECRRLRIRVRDRDVKMEAAEERERERGNLMWREKEVDIEREI